MCYDEADRVSTNARVACRELTGGYPARLYHLDHPEDSVAPIWLADVNCEGDEGALADCPSEVTFGEEANDVCTNRGDTAIECLAEGKCCLVVIKLLYKLSHLERKTHVIARATCVFF